MIRLGAAVMICVLLAGCGAYESNNSDDADTSSSVRATRTASPNGDRSPMPVAGTPPPGATVDETPEFVPDLAATGTALVAGTVPGGTAPDVTYAPETATPTFLPNEPIGTPPLPTATLLPSPFPRVGTLSPLIFSAGPSLTPADLAVRGNGIAARGAFTGERLRIPAIGVDAGLRIVSVEPNGVMPSPDSVQEVLWYDFSNFPGLGGLPGAGGNAIFAGDVRQPEGPGVFLRLSELGAGSLIELLRTDGYTLYYRVEFNKLADTSIDFTSIVAATADDSMTIITGAGTVAERRVLWARRVDAP